MMIGFRLSPRKPVAYTLSIALILGLSSIAPVASATAATSKPIVNLGKPVAGARAKALPAKPAPASSKSISPSKPLAPTAGSYKLSLPSTPVAAPVTTKDAKVGSPATAIGGWKSLGASGIAVAEAQSGGASAPQSPAASRPVSSVTATILNAAARKAAGLKGLVVGVKRADGVSTSSPVAVTIPDKYLDSLYGANFASRIRWVQVTPAANGSTKKSKAVPVASASDAATESTVITPSVSSARTLLVPAGAPVSSTGTGSFAATPLSAASSWQVSAQTGDFSWSYAMRTPPPAAGPSPQLALNYDSQSVDGESASTNNQPSAIGEGWSQSGGGFIERSYVSCSQDDGSSGPVTTSGDLCWKTDNATISFGGH
ncbi:MAG TPA: hypothetical protein VHU90_10960, partial [Galbitalea sp.]|nr:hypothetical protein [Galbitalea sp.]